MTADADDDDGSPNPARIRALVRTTISAMNANPQCGALARLRAEAASGDFEAAFACFIIASRMTPRGHA